MPFLLNAQMILQKAGYLLLEMLVRAEVAHSAESLRKATPHRLRVGLNAASGELPELL